MPNRKLISEFGGGVTQKKNYDEYIFRQGKRVMPKSYKGGKSLRRQKKIKGMNLNNIILESPNGNSRKNKSQKGGSMSYMDYMTQIEQAAEDVIRYGASQYDEDEINNDLGPTEITQMKSMAKGVGNVAKNMGKDALNSGIKQIAMTFKPQLQSFQSGLDTIIKQYSSTDLKKCGIEQKFLQDLKNIIDRTLKNMENDNAIQKIKNNINEFKNKIINYAVSQNNITQDDILKCLSDEINKRAKINVNLSELLKLPKKLGINKQSGGNEYLEEQLRNMNYDRQKMLNGEFNEIEQKLMEKKKAADEYIIENFEPQTGGHHGHPIEHYGGLIEIYKKFASLKYPLDDKEVENEIDLNDCKKAVAELVLYLVPYVVLNEKK